MEETNLLRLLFVQYRDLLKEKDAEGLSGLFRQLADELGEKEESLIFFDWLEDVSELTPDVFLFARESGIQGLSRQLLNKFRVEELSSNFQADIIRLVDRQKVLENLTPEYLVNVVGPFLEAVAELQGILDHVVSEKHSVAIRSITGLSPIEVSIMGASEASGIVDRHVKPWKTRCGENMAELEGLERDLLELKREAEALASQAGGAKDFDEMEYKFAEAGLRRGQAKEKEVETEKLRTEFSKAKIQLIRQIIKEVAPNLSDDEELAYITKLIPVIDRLIASPLELEVEINQ